MEIKNYFAQDAQGNIMPSANCYLYLPGTTTLATGLVDGSGTPISNPFLASSVGQVEFGAPNGVYDLRVALGARDWTIKVQCADIVQAMDVMDSILGSHAENPTTRNNGQPLESGDETWNSTDKQPYWWNGSGWIALNGSAKQLETLLSSPTGAGKVGVIQDGDGAGLRDLLEKSNDILNVKDYLITGSGDETSKFQKIITYASSAKKKLIIDIPVTITEVTANGHIDIETVGDGRINCIGSGRGAIIAKNTWELKTTFDEVGTAMFPASVGTENSYIRVDNPSKIALNDVLYVKDAALNAYTSTSACLAEIATVVAITGNIAYLDCRFRRAITSGSVYVLPKNKCRINVSMSGDSTVRASAVYAEGYVDSGIFVDIEKNSSRGVMLMSCLRGRYLVTASNLDDNPASNRLGYALVAYGACKGGYAEVFASNVRHAYTDGVYSSSGIESGNVLDFTVTGICNSPTAAGFDTHPDSDGTVFENIQVWGGHNDNLQPSRSLNFAVQLRGSNHTIRGLTTDLDKAIAIVLTRVVDSVDNISGVVHRDNLIGAPSGTNRLLSIVYFAAEAPSNPIPTTGTHKANICSSRLGLTQYEVGGVIDEFSNCEMDFSKTTAGWPSSPAAGGSHRYLNCDIKNPTSMALGANDEYYLNGTTVYAGAARSFSLGPGAKLTAIDSGIEAIGYSVPNSAFAYSPSSTSSGTVSFKFQNVWVNDDRVEGTITAFNNLSTGTAAVTVKNLRANTELKGFLSRGNADATLTVGITASTQRFSAALTADRSVTLSSINAKSGDSFTILRPASGAFNLNVGGLKSLAANQWCIVAYDGDGSAWRLAAFGSL